MLTGVGRWIEFGSWTVKWYGYADGRGKGEVSVDLSIIPDCGQRTTPERFTNHHPLVVRQALDVRISLPESNNPKALGALAHNLFILWRTFCRGKQDAPGVLTKGSGGSACYHRSTSKDGHAWRPLIRHWIATADRSLGSTWLNALMADSARSTHPVALRKG